MTRLLALLLCINPLAADYVPATAAQAQEFMKLAQREPQAARITPPAALNENAALSDALKKITAYDANELYTYVLEHRMKCEYTPRSRNGNAFQACLKQLRAYLAQPHAQIPYNEILELIKPCLPKPKESSQAAEPPPAAPMYVHAGNPSDRVKVRTTHDYLRDFEITRCKSTWDVLDEMGHDAQSVQTPAPVPPKSNSPELTTVVSGFQEQLLEILISTEKDAEKIAALTALQQVMQHGATMLKAEANNSPGVNTVAATYKQFLNKLKVSHNAYAEVYLKFINGAVGTFTLHNTAATAQDLTKFVSEQLEQIKGAHNPAANTPQPTKKPVTDPVAVFRQELTKLVDQRRQDPTTMNAMLDMCQLICLRTGRDKNKIPELEKQFATNYPVFGPVYRELIAAAQEQDLFKALKVCDLILKELNDWATA